ncbi:MAG TPA: GNAT family N-acetyltransferase [Candidatus Sulfotelmatobacter sp.]|nr:GNAT family N-acetyltransferase [Candidatus Sulfotelmatobacter sp.]
MRPMAHKDKLEPTNVGGSNGAPGQYPISYASEFLASDGTHFVVRPIRRDDEPLMADFHRHLSEETVYKRYFAPLRLDVRVAHERLLKRCLIDYHNEMALVAAYHDKNGQQHLAAVARLVKIDDSNRAEVAFVVADQHQHHGLGTYLLARIIDIAPKEGFDELEAILLADNFSMRDLFRHAGFQFLPPQGSDVTARLKLL